MNLISLLINILSFYTYYLSLEGCIGTQIDCLKIMTLDKFIEMFYLVLFSSFLLSITLIFSFFKIISIFCMIYPLIVCILFYIKDHGSDLSSHGLYNIIVFCMMLSFFFVLLLIIIYIIILYNKNWKKSFFSIIFSFIILIIIFILYMYSKTSCSNWNKGLNNVILNNDISKYSCKFVTPKKCYINAFDGIFDVSRYVRKNCKNINWGYAQKEKLLTLYGEEYLNKFIENSENFIKFFKEGKKRKNRKVMEIRKINIPSESENIKTISHNTLLKDDFNNMNEKLQMISTSTQTDIYGINTKIISFI